MEVISNMSSFYDNVKLDAMKLQSESELGKISGVCQNIDSTLKSKSNDSSLIKRIGSVVGVIFWVFAYSMIVAMVPNPEAISLIENMSILFFCIASIFIFVRIIDIILEFSYYGKISHLLLQLNSINKKIEKNKQSLDKTSSKLSEARNNGWNYAFEICDPILQQANNVQLKVDNLKDRKSGALNKLMIFLYYVISLIITVYVSRALYAKAYDISYRMLSYFLSVNLSEHVGYIILTVLLVIACIGEIFVAATALEMTDQKVNNLTLIGTLLGPVAFVILVAAVLLIVALLVLAIVLGIFALAFSCCSGG